MADLNEYDPPAIELRIPLKHFTNMVQAGYFGDNPASNAMLRNLQSFANYIAYSKQQYKLEVARRELAEEHIYKLQQEVAYLRSLHSKNNTVEGNHQYLGNPDRQWQVWGGSNY